MRGNVVGVLAESHTGCGVHVANALAREGASRQIHKQDSIVADVNLHGSRPFVSSIWVRAKTRSTAEAPSEMPM